MLQSLKIMRFLKCVLLLFFAIICYTMKKNIIFQTIFIFETHTSLQKPV